MAKKFDGLRRKVDPDRIQKNRERAAAILAAMNLAELRGLRDVTQERLAEQLDVAQSNVSRLERRTDMHVRTLQAVVEALGGELELVARFPEGAVRINQFEDAA